MIVEYAYDILINLSREKSFADDEAVAAQTHPFVFTYRGVINTTDPLDAAWAVVERHNRDDRPDGRLGPSFSAGDVVRIVEPKANTVQHYFDHHGMDLRPCQAPVNVDRDRLWLHLLREERT